MEHVDDASWLAEGYIATRCGLLQATWTALEVFHYHKAVVDTNYKLWHDTTASSITTTCTTSSSNRDDCSPATSIGSTRLPERPRVGRSMSIKYERLRGQPGARVGCRGWSGGWVLIDIFPGMTYNLRTSVLRMDTAIRSGRTSGDRVRGLGRRATRRSSARSACATTTPSGDVRSQPARGPAGRAGQGRAMRERTDSHWVIHGRGGERDHSRRDRHAPLLTPNGAGGWAFVPATRIARSQRRPLDPEPRHALENSVDPRTPSAN